SGDDSPATVERAMIELAHDWITGAGGVVKQGVAVEIGPLFALDAGGAARKIPPGTRVEAAQYFGWSGSQAGSQMPLRAACVYTCVNRGEVWTRREPPGKVVLLRPPLTEEALVSARSLLGLIEHQPTDQRVAALKRVISQSTVRAA